MTLSTRCFELDIHLRSLLIRLGRYGVHVGPNQFPMKFDAWCEDGAWHIVVGPIAIVGDRRPTAH